MTFSRPISSIRRCAGCCALLLLLISAGCATAPPVSFKLIDDHSVAFRGSYGGNDNHMEVVINDRTFQGFFIVGSGASQSTSDVIGTRRPHLVNSFSNFTTNDARAHLTSADGEHISCEFLFMDHRAVGECKSSTGKHYQFVADGT